MSTDTKELALWQQPGALATILKPEDGERTLTYVTRLMDMLPPPTEDVVDQIAAMILNAAGPGEENAFWDGDTLSSKDAVGQRFIFHSVHVHPSDYDNGPFPYFLAVKVTTVPDGEETILTTGSVNIVTALVKAQMLGSLPWEGEIVGPRRIPKSGRVPLHIRWYGRIVEPEEIDA